MDDFYQLGWNLGKALYELGQQSAPPGFARKRSSSKKGAAPTGRSYTRGAGKKEAEDKAGKKRAKPKCTKGVACGNTCIPANRKCSSETPTPTAKKAAQYLKRPKSLKGDNPKDNQRKRAEDQLAKAAEKVAKDRDTKQRDDQPTIRPTLKATPYNPRAIKDLTVNRFQYFLEQKKIIAEQEDPAQPWNRSRDAWADATIPDSSKVWRKKAFQQEIDNAIATGYVPSDQALADYGRKLSKSQQQEIEENKARIQKMREQVRPIQEAIDYPLMSDTDSKGYRPSLSREEANAYTQGSYAAGLSFYHGNPSKITDSMATEGVQPERNSRGIFGKGAYFATSREIAEFYTMNRPDTGIVEVQAKIKRPYIGTTEEIERIGSNFPGDQYNNVDSEAIRDYLKAQGHDSLYLQDYGYLVLFEQRQAVVTGNERVSDRRAAEILDFWTQNGVDGDRQIAMAQQAATHQAMAPAQKD